MWSLALLSLGLAASHASLPPVARSSPEVANVVFALIKGGFESHEEEEEALDVLAERTKCLRRALPTARYDQVAPARACAAPPAHGV